MSTGSAGEPEARRDEPEPVRIPINGVLDLHTFRPAEIGKLVPVYLAECQAAGIHHVRIIHGKGTGTLRETVHALLRRHPQVLAFGLANESGGGWGATVVDLRVERQSPRAEP